MAAAWTDNFLADGYDIQDQSIYDFLWRGVMERLAVSEHTPSHSVSLIAAFGAAGPAVGFDIQQWSWWHGLQQAVEGMFFVLWKRASYNIAGQAASQGFITSAGFPGFDTNSSTVFLQATYSDSGGGGSLQSVRVDAGLTGTTWWRKRVREVTSTSRTVDVNGHITWTSGATDAQGNTLADGMMAWINGRDLARFDVTANLWRWTGQGHGELPDLLDSTSTATGWHLPAGLHVTGDMIGGHLIYELVSIMSKLTAIAQIVGEPYLATGWPASTSWNTTGGLVPTNFSTAAAAESNAASVASPGSGSGLVVGGLTDVLAVVGGGNFQAGLEFVQGPFRSPGLGSASAPTGVPSINGQLATYCAVGSPGYPESGWGVGTAPAFGTFYGGNVPGWAVQNTYATADTSSAGAISANGSNIISATLGTSAVLPTWPTTPATSHESKLGWEIGACIMVVDFSAGPGNFMYP